MHIQLGKTQGELLEIQAKQVERIKGDRDSITRNPTLWFVLGALTMGFAARAFTR